MRLISADWNGTGGVVTAGSQLRLNWCIESRGGWLCLGSRLIGISSTRLAQRVRALILPSVMTVSPLFKLTR